MGIPGLRFPTLYRYIFREITTPFLLALFVFTGVLFLIRSLRMVDMVINKDIPIVDIVLLFSYIVPAFLELAIPMSLLIAVMLAFGRLSADSELVVIRATGTSIGRLLTPVVLFSIMAFGFTLFLSLFLRPYANYQLGVGLFEVAKMKATSGLVPGIFNELGKLTIYASEVDGKTGRLSNVIIADRREEGNPRTFLARHGDLVADNLKRQISLKLYDGTIHEGRGLNFQLTNFEINSIVLGHDELMANEPTRGGKKAKEMFLSELDDQLQQLHNTYGPLEKKHQRSIAYYSVETHRRFALPVSCLCIGILAMALGVQPSRGGHHWGASANIAVGVICIFFYYLIVALGEALGRNLIIYPWVGMWAPNIVFSIMAVVLIRQVGTERWLAVSEAFADWYTSLLLRLKLAAASTNKPQS